MLVEGYLGLRPAFFSSTRGTDSFRRSSAVGGFKKRGGGAGGGYGAQGMGRGASTPRGFGHEYGHGMSIQWWFGNSEILAQSIMELTDSRCTSYHHNVLIP